MIYPANVTRSLSGTFAAVKRLVGCFDQRFGGTAVIGEDGDSHGSGDAAERMAAIVNIEALDGFLVKFRALPGNGSGSFRQDESEFLSAVAAGDILAAYISPQQRSEFFQAADRRPHARSCH